MKTAIRNSELTPISAYVGGVLENATCHVCEERCHKSEMSKREVLTYDEDSGLPVSEMAWICNDCITEVDY